MLAADDHGSNSVALRQRVIVLSSISVRASTTARGRVRHRPLTLLRPVLGPVLAASGRSPSILARERGDDGEPRSSVPALDLSGISVYWTDAL